MTEREKMLAGEPYDAFDAELDTARRHAREVAFRFNTAGPLADVSILRELLAIGDGVAINPPFQFDYGWNITLADGVFMNFGCVILDCAPVRVGAKTQIGPRVQLNAATHPLEPEERAAGVEYARPIEVGANVWLAAGVIVGAGVTIGDDAVVGAGSVVLRDVPARAFVAGVPAHVIREL